MPLTDEQRAAIRKRVQGEFKMPARRESAAKSRRDCLPAVRSVDHRDPVGRVASHENHEQEIERIGTELRAGEPRVELRPYVCDELAGRRFNAAEAAAELGITKAAFYAAMKEGRSKPLGEKGLVFYRDEPDELEMIDDDPDPLGIDAQRRQYLDEHWPAEKSEPAEEQPKLECDQFPGETFTTDQAAQRAEVPFLVVPLAMKKGMPVGKKKLNFRPIGETKPAPERAIDADYERGLKLLDEFKEKIEQKRKRRIAEAMERIEAEYQEDLRAFARLKTVLPYTAEGQKIASDFLKEDEPACMERPRNARAVVNVETGEIYPTQTVAMRKTGILNSKIGRACKSGQPVEGIRFRFASPAEAERYWAQREKQA